MTIHPRLLATLRLIPPLDLKRDLEAGARWRDTAWGMAAALVVISYCAAPFLQYTHPGNLLSLGAALGGSLVAIYGLFIYRGLAGFIFLLVTIAFGSMFVDRLQKTVKPAAISVEANQRRCLAIQKDMLSSSPLRSDGPDLFQALGCRPQGEGSVYAQHDTKGDPGAMLEQDARRSELPYRNPYRSDGSGAVLK